MWLSMLPDISDTLRQGDLLLRAPFPIEKSPPVDSSLNYAVELKAAIVVEQCCNIQQQRVVRLARVAQLVVGGDQRRGLEMTDPRQAIQRTRGEGIIPFPVRQFRLVDPPMLPQRPPKNLYCAQALRTVEYDVISHGPQFGCALRTLPPKARHLLRTKLAALIGRAEDEDRETMTAAGLTPEVLPV